VDRGHEPPKAQQGRAEVALENEHTHGNEPGNNERPEVLHAWEGQWADFLTGQQNEVTISAQVRSKEDGQRQFGHFTGLEGTDAEVDPNAGTINFHADKR